MALDGSRRDAAARPGRGPGQSARLPIAVTGTRLGTPGSKAPIQVSYYRRCRSTRAPARERTVASRQARGRPSRTGVAIDRSTGDIWVAEFLRRRLGRLHRVL